MAFKIEESIFKTMSLLNVLQHLDFIPEYCIYIIKSTLFPLQLLHAPLNFMTSSVIIIATYTRTDRQTDRT